MENSAGLQVPNGRGPTHYAAGRDSRAVGAEGQLGEPDGFLALECPDHLAGRHVPNAHGTDAATPRKYLVRAAPGKQSAVATEAQSGGRELGAREGEVTFQARRQVPD